MECWILCKRYTTCASTNEFVETFSADIIERTSVSSVSLDPDEDRRDPTLFDGLRDFITNDLVDAEKEHLISVTMKNLAQRAQSLKMHRPARGLEFSLQQQGMMILIFSEVY